MRYVNVVKTVDDGLQEMMKNEDGNVRRIIFSCVKYMRNLTTSFWIIALITGNLMCVHSAVVAIKYHFFEAESPPNLILLSWFPFASCNHFWLSYAIQYYIMNIGMLIVPCWHSFIVSIMVFVIMKLQILNHELTKIGESSDTTLTKCVQERQKLFSFITELKSLISSSIFLDFIVFSVLLCALLFQAIQVNDTTLH